MKYNKPPLDIQGQCDVLEKRGLIIPDTHRIVNHLENIGYYRLSAYMLPYKIVGKNEFKSGTTWDNVYDLYVFDRKLRLLLFDTIERIEVGVRSQIIYHLSLKYGSHWHDNKDIFRPIQKYKKHDKNRYTIDVYDKIQDHIRSIMQSNSTEVFIKHYKSKYKEPQNPPCWMSVETLYFRHLSLICEGLKDKDDLKKLAAHFGIKKIEIFNSWLHTINFVRNICAHHSRLWNRELNIIPAKLLKPDVNKKWISNIETIQSSRIYYILCIINYFLQTINPSFKLKDKLKLLFDEFKSIDNRYMGFPENWEQEDIWK